MTSQSTHCETPGAGILFDLDETLIDRAASIRAYATEFWRDFFRELAVEVAIPSLAAEDLEAHYEQVERVLGLPILERARKATRVWRELNLWFPDGEHLVEGKVDLVFEEDSQLVVVDYKSDAIAEGQALDQAAHHAAQLQLYGRGLSQALGQSVRERLVLFTALGRTVPV